MDNVPARAIGDFDVGIFVVFVVDDSLLVANPWSK
jgi:hypothetical protein